MRQAFTPPTWPPRGWIQTTAGIDDQHPAFTGHFPGRPLLPGIAQLWLATGLAAERYGAVFPRGVQRAKFRAPIGPWARFELALFPTRAMGEVEFELRSNGDMRQPPPDQGQVLSGGFLQLAATAPTAAPAAVAPPRVRRPDQPPITALLPHRGPALLLQELLAFGQGNAPSWFGGRVPADNFLVHDGRVSCFAALELIAQAAACIDRLRRWPEQPARRLTGPLVLVRAATFARPDFALGDGLVAAIRTTTRGAFVQATAQVSAGAQLLSDAELQIRVQ